MRVIDSTIVRTVSAAWIAVLIMVSAALADEPSPVSLSSAWAEPGSGYRDALAEINKAASVQTGSSWIEPADTVLIQRREVEWNRYLRSALLLPDWIDLGLENRTRFETYDHPWRASQAIGNGEADPQILLRSRVRVGLGGNGPLRLLFEGQDARAYLNGDPGDFQNITTVNESDILQLFGSLTVHNVFGSGLRTDVHFGRMTMDFGKRRYIARNDFRNTTNSFDGFHWQISQDNRWRFRAFFVEPVVRDQARLDTSYDTSLFWGAYLESQHIPWFELNAFYFGLNDQQLPNPTLHRKYSTFGLRLFKAPAINEFDYDFEGAIQVGRLGTIDHFAYNPNVEVGYTFDLPWTPRLLAQFTYASGTTTPGGSQSGNFDPLFGARRFDLVPTGNFGPFFRSNISSPGWRLMIQPARDWTVQVKHRFWYLAQGRALFVGGLLQDPAGGAGNYLGHDLEVRVQWALTMNLDFDLGYDHWFKGSYFDRLPASAGLPAGGNKDTDYFYVQMRLRV